MTTVTKICYPAIEQRRSDLGVPKQRMADYLGIAYSTLDNKMAGNNEFKFSEVAKLSEWWNVPLESFTEGAYEITT